MNDCFDENQLYCKSYGPYQEPIVYNGKLYGTTVSSGFVPGGSIYSISPDLSDFTVLHNFSYDGGDGYNSYGKLLEVSGVLYGMSGAGGANGAGTIYKINPDGTGYSIIYSFTGQPAAGSPQGSLILYNNKLYGMTVAGGTSNKGTVFSINTDGTGYQTLKSFTGGADGSYPAYYGYLTVYNDVLYGMTAQDGSSWGGVMFKLNPDGTGYTVLYNFNNTSGTSPYGGFVNIGGTFYGVMPQGGSLSKGTIFKIQPDGTGLTVLHAFAGGGTGGQAPYGSVFASGGKLYGTTYQGGDSNVGTVFSINEDGTGFTLLYEFSESIANGKLPRSGLTLEAGQLYGTTYSSYNSGPGSIFHLSTDGSSSAHLTLPLTRTRSLNSELTAYGGKLYGTSATGGRYVRGSLFSINLDGTSPTVLHEFPSSTSDGYTPYGALIEIGGYLYGTTSSGGTNNGGVIFKMNANGSNYSILYQFDCADSGGCQPYYGRLLHYNGELYGATAAGGTSGLGVIFKLALDGSGYTVLHTFTGGGSDGAEQYNMNLAVYNGQLFGFTERGGDNNWGTAYRIDPDGTNFTLLHEFTGGVSDGKWPETAPTMVGDTLYGTTNGAGVNASGTIFSLKSDGTGFTLLHSFDSANTANGSEPFGGLLYYGNTLYGATQYGGTNGQGTLYEIKPDGSGFILRHSFERNTTDKGGSPLDTPTAYAGFLWVTTVADVTGYNLGTIYKMALPDIIPPTISNISPASLSTIATSTPAITYNLNEAGDCRASFTDEAYDDMSSDIDCSGDGTTSISCTTSDLGTNGTKTLYFACKDALSNKDTVDTNTTVTYELLLPTPTPSPTASAVPAPSQSQNSQDSGSSSLPEDTNATPIPIQLELVVAVNSTSDVLQVTWNAAFSSQDQCNVEITDTNGNQVYSFDDLTCSESFILTPEQLKLLAKGATYTLKLSAFDSENGTVLGIDTTSFTYQGETMLLTPTVSQTTKPVPTNKLTVLWWILSGSIVIGLLRIVLKNRNKKS
jgi:uncharacterized repeat protein (TIGR03803 family)